MLSAVDILWFVVFGVVMAAMWWLAFRMDPHYSSKDGSRFLCLGQELVDGQANGRRKETRVTVLPDGVLLCSQKRYARRSEARWAIVGKSQTPPKKKEVFLVRQFDDGKWLAPQLALTIPANSRVIAVLDDAMARRGVNP
jgi:hypothetical protein